MELPVVNHPEYVAKINENSVFPIKKFSALAKYLVRKNIVKKLLNKLLNQKDRNF